MKISLFQHITAPRIGVAMQIVMACILTISAATAWSSWQAQASRQQIDATLRYFDRLMDSDYVRSLWEIEEFTLCYERAAKQHLSYMPFAEVRGKDPSYKLATGWWTLVENEEKEIEACGKPDRLEEKLMLVYGQLEALASCARQKLCSYSRIVDMIEAFDHMTVLSVSNYLLLTREPERKISREWTMNGALVDLVGMIEKHVFEGRRSSVALARQLDAQGSELDNTPELRPDQVAAIRNKHTHCQKPSDPTEAVAGNWRRCAGTK